MRGEEKGAGWWRGSGGGSAVAAARPSQGALRRLYSRGPLVAPRGRVEGPGVSLQKSQSTRRRHCPTLRREGVVGVRRRRRRRRRRCRRRRRRRLSAGRRPAAPVNSRCKVIAGDIVLGLIARGECGQNFVREAPHE